MSLSPETLVFGLGIFLALWYLGASIFNRRRGLAIFRWLRDGLDQLGGEVSARWIGSSGSGARIQMHKANPPFKEIEIIYLLASRELLPLFLVDLLRNKRDQIIIKAALRSAFHGEAEVVPVRSRLARQMLAEKAQPWSIEEAPHRLLIGVRGRNPEVLRASLTPVLEKHGPHIRQVSLSHKAPHLIVVLWVAGLYEKGGSAASLYSDLAAFAPPAQQKS